MTSSFPFSIKLTKEASEPDTPDLNFVEDKQRLRVWIRRGLHPIHEGNHASAITSQELCVVQRVAEKGETPVVIEVKARIGRKWSRYVWLKFMQKQLIKFDTVHTLNGLTEPAEKI